MRKSDWLHLDVLNGEKSLLLHACCAPCSGAIVECMLKEGLEPVIFYSNPNIFPLEEYEKRRDECKRYALANSLEFVEDPYDHQLWKSIVAKGRESVPERGARCLECFRFRLCRSAEYASAHGFHYLTTTLASSRWKNLEQVNQAGIEACAPFPDLKWWDQNWRKGGLQERRGQIIKEQNFYNQLYCGCEYSQKD